MQDSKLSMNDWIRMAAGRLTVTDATQGETQQPAPRLPDANAGAGARSAGVGVARVSMSDVIRAARYGGRNTWTTYK